ncbi:tetratricopeptide repeat protein [uncultured Algoriphagus sp.]|uniref:tetratricopeptide repeat protein n=1 Tax=uncultured Algoriphagus sp. TaxID=417365 RepID=UPI00259282F5|nr:tetratricopeptide repeat protein [uncultured Algoriphagus sp.]
MLLRCWISFAFFWTVCLAQAQVNRVDSLKASLDAQEEKDSAYVLLLIELCEASTFTEEQGGLDYARKALEISQEISFPKGEALANNSLGAYYLQVGNLNQALQYVLAAERVYLQNEDQSEGLLSVYNNLGIIYNRTGEVEKAIEVYLDAIQIASQNTSNFQQLAILYNNLGSAYDNLGDYDQALQAFEKVEAVSREADLQVGVMMAKSNLGSVYFSKNDLNRAESEYIMALEIAQKGGFTRNVGTIMLGMADVYSGQGRYQEAEKYFRDGIALAEEIQALPLLEDGYRGLGKLYERRGNFSLALNSFKKWQNIRDSIFSLEKAQTIEELKAQYETEKKEAEILALSQENEIQSLELTQKNQLLFLSIVGTILLIGLGYSIYLRKKIRAEAKMSEIEQRFLRSQLNPHFIFNALSSVQNYMLNSESKKASYYLGKFSKLMRQVLENSREEYIPLEEEIGMLENYLEVQKNLSQKQFDFQISCLPPLDSQTYEIPPMFVQPFVENAIQHGIQNQEGEIELEFSLVNEYVQVKIKDNGLGIKATVKPSSRHQSLATSIIGERIENYNRKLKNQIQLKITDLSEKGLQGTEVVLLVPFSKNY